MPPRSTSFSTRHNTDLVARAVLRLFLEAADDRLGDPDGQRGLRRRRGLHQGIFARTLYARLVDALLVGPRTVRYARGFLVGHRLRDSPGRLVFLAPDHHRRP